MPARYRYNSEEQYQFAKELEQERTRQAKYDMRTNKIGNLVFRIYRPIPFTSSTITSRCEFSSLAHAETERFARKMKKELTWAWEREKKRQVIVVVDTYIWMNGSKARYEFDVTAQGIKNEKQWLKDKIEEVVDKVYNEEGI